MKLYECIVDDGTNIFKTTVASKNKKELLNVYGGNGTFEKITDITQLTDSIGVDLLRDTLIRNGYGNNETTLICALLEEHLKQFNK